MIQACPPPEAKTSVSRILVNAYETSPRAHLFHFYPVLLEMSFTRCRLPSMWIFPAEHAKLFGLPEESTGADVEADGDGDGEDGQSGKNGVSAGDGADLIEVNARDIARRCLELIGEEMGLKA
jgi:hypothetical protein